MLKMTVCIFKSKKLLCTLAEFWTFVSSFLCSTSSDTTYMIYFHFVIFVFQQAVALLVHGVLVSGPHLERVVGWDMVSYREVT